MKKVLKWMGIALLAPVLLVAMLAVSLYIPPIQNWAVKKAASVASEKTGMDISVERVRLQFPLDLRLEGFRMLRQNDSLPQCKDTIADIRSLVVDVQLWPLLKKQVEVDELEVNGLRFNTTDFVDAARVSGTAEKLRLQAGSINLRGDTLRLDEAILEDGNIHVEMADSVPEDTTTSENRWKILVDKLNVERTQVSLNLPGDTLRAHVYMNKVEATDGNIDLENGLYQIGKIDWNDGSLTYDNRFEPRREGLDYNHLALSDIHLNIDSLVLKSPPTGETAVAMKVGNAAFKEKSGLDLKELSGTVDISDQRISLPDLKLRTPESSINAQVAMDMNAFDEKHPGELSIAGDATIGKQDMVRMAGNAVDSKTWKSWPNAPLTMKVVAKGNMKHLHLAGLNAKLPSAFNINTKGTLSNLDDISHLKANLTVDAKTQDLGFATTMLPKGTLDGIHPAMLPTSWPQRAAAG